jgi:hypothetical protein
MTETAEDDDAINYSIFVYNGVDAVPSTVTHGKVDSSLTHFSPSDFWRFGSVVKVELPGGIRMIGRKAFSFCRFLKSIDVPSTVTEIGELAFDSCHHLDDIVLPGGLVKLGEGAFYNCISLQTIHIPPLIQTIEARTFLGCTSLTEVILPLGLQEIKKYAFQSCEALLSIDFPSSLRVIGELAFDGAGLTEFNLPDSVEDCGTFSKCYFTNLRMPPLITKFDALTFGVEVDSDTIVSIELPEHIEQVIYPDNAQKWFYELRNFVFPAKCSVFIGNDMEEDEKYFLHDLVHRFRHRFDGLPLHKLCYYHSYHDTAKVLLDMKCVIHPRSTKTRCGKLLSDIGNRQDFIGMTPLHVLACSTKQPLAIYQLLVEKYPKNLVTKDACGYIPLAYAFRCNAPSEIIEFLAESYISKYADFEFDFVKLAQCCASLHRIQILLDTHRRCSPEQKDN